MSPDVPTCPACRAPGATVLRPHVFGEIDLYACPACRTEFVSPQPTDERLGEIYGPEYYAPWGAESGEVVHTIKRMSFEPALDACGIVPGTTVLDLGCASGSLIAEAVRRGAAGYGIDLNSDAIAEAVTRVPEGRFHAGIVADRPFPDVSFDAVVMIDFIEHVRDPEAELQVVREITHPGSRLVISTPRTDSVLRTLTGRHWPQYREEHLVYFSRQGMVALLSRCGFAVERVARTRKALTLAYAYGQAVAYPVPVATPVTTLAYRAIPPLRHRPVKVSLGEMTVIATRVEDA